MDKKELLKLGLPEDFGIYFEIEDDDKTILDLSKKVHDKLNHFSHILEDILNPEHLRSLHESSMFNEEDKKIVLRLYRHMQYHSREFNLLEIKKNEDELKEFIKNSYDGWKKIIPDLKEITTKLKNSWNTDKKTKLELGYFG